MNAQHMTPVAAALALLGLAVSGSAFAAGEPCAMCHAGIAQGHGNAAHKAVACTTCHTGTEAHLKDMKKHPTVSMDPALCGTCHQAQYKSAFTISEHLPRVSKKLDGGPAPDPFFDRALGGHGFTKEHAVPRAHAFMAIDQFIVDRAFGGRFEPKDGWLYSTMEGGKSYKVWDVLKDNYPDNNTHKAHKPGTAAAANGVCWSCKSTDIMLDWAYMGDKVEGAKFFRGSNPVDVVRNVQHGLNCNFCHDPHNVKPRVVRDALIDAMTRDGKFNVYKDFAARQTKLDVQSAGVRGFERKVAYLERADSRLMCAQCHVEYVCNPGMNVKTGQKVGFDSRLTNLFPWVNADQIEAYYDEVGFRDFKHNVTGATLIKMQHPDAETYFGSKHDKAGADCATCHMPKVTENGKTYTLHWNASPVNYVKETCLTCHKDKTEKQMVTSVEVMKAHFDGKVREAESRMNDMFNAFEQAINAGVDDAVLAKARKLHESAHVNWEYWTAANGAYFHNHDMAVRSLAKSAKAAQDATALLRKAIAEKNGKKTAAK